MKMIEAMKMAVNVICDVLKNAAPMPPPVDAPHRPTAEEISLHRADLFRKQAEAIKVVTVHRSRGLSYHAAACDLAIKQAEATQARDEAAQGVIDVCGEIRGRNNKDQG